MRFITRCLFLSAMLLLLQLPSAFAFYDDVHYSLNYVIARVIGFTPEQAYRIANACVSVDWTPQTEPTQLEGGIAQLRANKMLTAEYLPLGSVLNALRLKYLGSPDEWAKSLEEIPAAVDGLLTQPEFRKTFEAQWKFHAFRDLYRFPNAKVDGPPYPSPSEEANAKAADDAIIEQHNLLFEESFQLKNPGVFLHFFQDEVPHHGYAIGGGHWVLLPNQWKQADLWEKGFNGLPVSEWSVWSQWANFDKRGSFPTGSTTDWLSYRSVDSNMKMVRETADYMLKFMQRASQGLQKPVVDSPDRVAEIISPLIVNLRAVNEAPVRLKTMKEVIDTKLLQAGKISLIDDPAFQGGADRLYREKTYGKHAHGPSVKAAHDVMNPFLNNRGIENVPDISEPPDPAKVFTITQRTDTTGAKIENVDQSVLYGELRIRIQDPGVASKSEPAPAKISVTVKSVPAQNGEQPYEIKNDSASVFPEALNGKDPVLEFKEIQAGDVDVEVKYFDSDGKVTKSFSQRMRILNQINQEPITASSAPTSPIQDQEIPVDGIVKALQSVGLEAKITKSKSEEYVAGWFKLHNVEGTKGQSKNDPADFLTYVDMTPWPDDAHARKDYKGGDPAAPDFKTEPEFFDVGAEEKAMVELPPIWSYPNNMRYARGRVFLKFRCGNVIGFMRHQIESDKGMDYEKAGSEEMTAFEAEEANLKPLARNEAKQWAISIVNALAANKACSANPQVLGNASPPASTGNQNANPPASNVPVPSAPALGNSGNNWPSPAGVNQPAAGGTGPVSSAPYVVPPSNSSIGFPPSPPIDTNQPSSPSGVNPPGTVSSAPYAVPPLAPSSGLQPAPPISPAELVNPEAIKKRRQENSESAARSAVEFSEAALAISISNLFSSPNIPDSVAFDFFAAASVHIARRNLPAASCYGGDLYVNNPSWDAHRAMAAQNTRQFLIQRLGATMMAAMKCLRKPAQDSLYADIYESATQAFNGQVVRVPDVQRGE